MLNPVLGDKKSLCIKIYFYIAFTLQYMSPDIHKILNLITFNFVNMCSVDLFHEMYCHRKKSTG